jgi:BNR repeat-like domain
MPRLPKKLPLGLIIFATAILLAPIGLRAAEVIKPKLVSSEVVEKTPNSKSSVGTVTYYTEKTGTKLIGTRSISTRSDTTDSTDYRFSDDNGTTWSEWKARTVFQHRKNGTYRVGWIPGWVDPVNGKLLEIANAGLLPSDNPLEGVSNWTLRYRVSTDGGNTYPVDQQIIEQGDQYNPNHPLKDVWVGKNSMMIGTVSCEPIRTKAGKILVPFQTTILGPDGKYFNPGGGYTYHATVLLTGTWIGDEIQWESSKWIYADPKLSTRGMIEPTIAEMPDGRILVVMRGSNHTKPELPSYKWYAVSEDGGKTFDSPRPWTFADGTKFYSPSSSSQLISHSNGNYYWVGNISPKNCNGNHPRYPLVIGQVDPKSLLLMKDSITVIDTKKPEDDADLQLSNFYCREDRKTGQIVVELCRFFHKKGWRGNSIQYRIDCPSPTKK